MRTTHMRWAALLAAGGLALAGCGAGDEGGSSDAAPQMTTTQAPGEGSGAGSEEADSSSAASTGDRSSQQSGQKAPSKGGTGYKEPVDARIARSASLSISVDDVEQASAKVRSAAKRAEGYVSDEDSRSATREGGRSWAEITVTVPVSELDSTIADLSEIGKVTQRSSTAEDLTSQYTDTAARVRSKKASVERLRKLIASTDDLDQIVTLESELATREADLESMTSQQKSLEKRTATAPITVSLSTGTPRPDDEPEDETGFLAGLSGGWGAFTSALEVGATALGAVTPFAITGLLLGSPVVWWLRRRRTSGTDAAPDAG